MVTGYIFSWFSHGNNHLGSSMGFPLSNVDAIEKGTQKLIELLPLKSVILGFSC